MIAIVGASGYIGSQFQHELESRGKEFVTLSRCNTNYYDYLQLVDCLKQSKATAVINAAGYTGKPNVDQCEFDKSGTITGNVVLCQIVGQACDMLEIPLVHVSSGCIYSGDKGVDQHGTLIGFHEDDEPNFSFESPPCSFYSGTKALGEKLLQQFEQVYTCRLRIPFDNESCKRNYLYKLQQYDKLLHATNTMSHRHEFVRACLELLEHRCDYGIYNVTNTGYVTTQQVVDMMYQILKPSRVFEFWENDDQFYKKGAITPRSNCVMDNTKLRATGIDMSSCEESIENALNTWCWS